MRWRRREANPQAVTQRGARVRPYKLRPDLLLAARDHDATSMRKLTSLFGGLGEPNAARDA